MLDDDIIEMARAGDRIGAVKLYRERYRVDQEQARDGVDNLMHEQAASVPVPTPAQIKLWQSDPMAAINQYRSIYPVAGLNEVQTLFERYQGLVSPGLSGEQLKEVLRILRANGKVAAIKVYRAYRPRIGLRQAKEAVEKLAADYNVQPSRDSRCFVATAAFGHVDAPEVQILRQWRDATLMPTAPGRCAVRVYYSLSPPLARWIADNQGRRRTVRVLLHFIVRRLL